MSRLRVPVPVLVLAVATVVGACGSSTTLGTAVAGSSTAEAVAFDPCTQVTDTVITSLGLLPETKKPYTQKGTTVESGCGWDDAPTMGHLLVDIGFNNKRIDEYLTGLGVTDPPEQTIGGRRVAKFQSAAEIGTCTLAIDLGSAVAIVATLSASQTAGVPNPDSWPGRRADRRRHLPCSSLARTNSTRRPAPAPPMAPLRSESFAPPAPPGRMDTSPTSGGVTRAHRSADRWR